MAYPENTCRAVFQFQLPNGTAGFVTPHFRKSDGGDYTQAELDGLADVLEDWYTNDDFEGETNQALKASLSDDVTLSSITLTRLGAAPSIQSVVAVGVAGEIAGFPLPNETSLVVTLYTGSTGRSYRGRNFWPGISTVSMQQNGTLSDTLRNQLQATFEALIAGLVSGTSSELCVNSETLGLSTFVTSCVVRNVLHHQRRRNS